jgi:hypothetical protein
MMRLLAALVLVPATFALAQDRHKYLIFPDQPSCIAYSQGRWDCSTGPLKAGNVDDLSVAAGSYAMRLDWGKYQVLPSTDQQKLVTGAALAPLASPGLSIVP